MRKSITFLRNWIGQMSIPEDEAGLIDFVKETLESKLTHYDRLMDYYNHDRYPQKEITIAARDLMSDILTQKRNHVAFLNRLIERQDDIRDSAEDMEEIETFFKSQRTIFDAARKLQRDLHNEIDYFAADVEANEKIREISDILAMAKPYARIKDLTDLMQGVRTAYDKLLTEKRKYVQGIITECMSQVHTLAGGDSRVNEQVRQSDARFTEYKQRVGGATSLTVLDATITQSLNYKDQIMVQIESKLNYKAAPPPPQKIVKIRRDVLFPFKTLTSSEEVDQYLDEIRKKLHDNLKTNDGIQIN